MSMGARLPSVEALVLKELDESAKVKKDLKRKAGEIVGLAEEMYRCLKKGGKIFLCGNGGSATDAQHIAGELVGKFLHDRKALPGIALTVNPSIVTAVSNDSSFDDVFARQVQALMTKDDLLICISTSGNSTNIRRAVQQAKTIGARTAALLGKGGGETAKMVNRALIVPSDSTPRIQEAHVTIGHIVCGLVEEWVVNERR